MELAKLKYFGILFITKKIDVKYLRTKHVCSLFALGIVLHIRIDNQV